MGFELLDSILELLKNLVNVLPSVAILAATIYYISRRTTPQAYMLLSGSVISLFTQLFYAFGIPLLTRNAPEVDFYSSYEAYLLPVSIASTIGSILFAVGLFMLIHEAVKSPAPEDPHNR